MRLKLAAIRLDFQPPENLIEETVGQYVESIRRREILAPVVVRFNGESYFLQDGFHRIEALRRENCQEVEAEVISGTLSDMEAEFRLALERLKQDWRR